MKLDPCLADAPCRLPGPAISKCDALRAYRSSTCAGPFDAVIDVVRNRRLMRGYFFFRRLVFLAPFFAAFAIFLRFFAMLPS